MDTCGGCSKDSSFNIILTGNTGEYRTYLNSSIFLNTKYEWQAAIISANITSTPQSTYTTTTTNLLPVITPYIFQVLPSIGSNLELKHQIYFYNQLSGVYKAFAEKINSVNYGYYGDNITQSNKKKLKFNLVNKKAEIIVTEEFQEDEYISI